MGLYLCIFDDEEEIDGVEVGPYADFTEFRDCVVRELEGGKPGARFPTLIIHSDCDGEWSPADAIHLEQELAQIGREFLTRPPMAVKAAWKIDTIKMNGLKIENLYDCFFDVDGEPLLERLIVLAQLSQRHDRPILFQ